VTDTAMIAELAASQAIATIQAVRA
jgi:hypothetical protein